MRDESGSEPGWKSIVAGEVLRDAPFFHRIAYRILRDHAAAADACQQGYLKVLEQPHGVPAISSLRAWLTRSIVNESLRVLRRRKLENKTIVISASHAGPAAVSFELQDAMMDAMEKLPEVTRTITMLRLVEGMSGNEVKEMMSLSASEVSRQFQQGMEHLRIELKDWRHTHGK